MNNAPKEDSEIRVINSLGQVVLLKQGQKQHSIEIDLSKQASGIYTIQIINGNQEISQQIIKQ